MKAVDRMHVFAHNGDLPGIEGSAVLPTGPYRLVGQTDSERASCALLARMRTLWVERACRCSHRPLETKSRRSRA